MLVPPVQHSRSKINKTFPQGISGGYLSTYIHVAPSDFTPDAQTLNKSAKNLPQQDSRLGSIRNAASAGPTSDCTVPWTPPLHEENRWTMTPQSFQVPSQISSKRSAPGSTSRQNHLNNICSVRLSISSSMTADKPSSLESLRWTTLIWQQQTWNTALSFCSDDLPLVSVPT